MSDTFRSLRLRLLLPLAAVSLMVAIAVAIGSYWQGDRWARQQIATRYHDVAETLSGAPFPLYGQVIQSLANLTDTQLLALRSDGSIAAASIEIESRLLPNEIAKATKATEPDAPIRIGDQLYRYGIFPRGGPAASSDGVQRVVVLFAESRLRESRLRAAALPLVTGLSTVFLLTTVALFLVSRLVRRLTRLSQQVDEIAQGNFGAPIDTGRHDEVGLLGRAVDRMSGQLQQMWQSLTRTQGEKLLHQIAGGLAHQLRNSLTGARMAVELHRNKCQSNDQQTLDVALSQLEQTEDAVRRLLLVAAGKQDADRPGTVDVAISDVQKSLSPTADHLRIPIQWDVDPLLRGQIVCDAPSLTAALSNLVLNAIQVASSVRVVATRQNDLVQISVVDDGPGPPDEIAEELFQPFVTSKPEGLGLGLPLVARAAQRLGGQVDWSRSDVQTEFLLTAEITDPPSERN